MLRMWSGLSYSPPCDDGDSLWDWIFTMSVWLLDSGEVEMRKTAKPG